MRKLRMPLAPWRGESWQFSAHLDVSEVSRLGLLGGTTGRAGADARSSNEAAEAVASPESRRRAASALIDSHDAVFRRTARRYSICADDGEDSYQRAPEIFLTKAPPIEGDNLVRWMQTVTKREALAMRRQRERLLGSPRLSHPTMLTSGTPSTPLHRRVRDPMTGWLGANASSAAGRR